MNTEYSAAEDPAEFHSCPVKSYDTKPQRAHDGWTRMTKEKYESYLPC